MIIYCIIITILFLLLSFLYLRLRSDVRTGERQIEYIQKEKSAMKLSLPDSLPALRHIVEMVEEQRDEVMQMRREQQRKDQEMKEMISCISHDIRTPLTSISGYIEMPPLSADHLFPSQRHGGNAGFFLRVLQAASRSGSADAAADAALSAAV